MTTVNVDQLSMSQGVILDIESGIFRRSHDVASQERGSLGPQVRIAQYTLGRYSNLARCFGLGAKGQRGSCQQHKSARLLVRVLQLFAVCLRAQWFLWTRLFL